MHLAGTPWAAVPVVVLGLIAVACSGSGDGGKDAREGEEWFAPLMNGGTAADTISRWASTPCLG